MQRTAYVLMLLTTLFWAGNAVAGKMAVGHVSPMFLSFARWALTLVILAVIGRQHIARDWATMRERGWYLMFMGFLGFTVFSVAMYSALLYTSATNVAIEQGGMPLFVFAAMFVLFRSKATLAQLAGFLLSFAGVMLTAVHGDIGSLLHLEVNFGDALMLFAIIVYGFYTAALRLKPAIHWMSLMTAMCAGALIGALPFVAAEAAYGTMILPDATGWMIVAYVVLFPSLIGQATYIRSVELIGANRAGLFINFLPLWGALLAVVILGEAFHLYHLVALALIFAGIWLAERGGRRGIAIPTPP